MASVLLCRSGVPEVGPSFDRQRVAVDGRREATLRAEAELLERHVFRRFVDPPRQIILAFECRPFARNGAEDHPLAPPWHEAQRLELAGAGIVVFEKAVDRELAEQRLGDVVVAALGHPGGAEIAAAHVSAHRYAPGLAGERGADQADVGQMLLVTVAADAGHIGALREILDKIVFSSLSPRVMPLPSDGRLAHRILDL
jgi:hypothetical protein